ncbi:MAG: fibronectin type III domain-containing protein [Verrucomicrobiae bacterium]|nr:fibronectin type III domain-containing protein [Verrucomicrobiae bacterium]
MSILAHADMLIDNFESSNAPVPWTFFAGTGASGSLTLGSGYSGHGAHLAYNFTGGGTYVSAHLNWTNTSSLSAIGFWVRTAPNTVVNLLVVDSSGQTLTYVPSRPMEVGMITNIWYQHVVPLDSAYSWSGGMNDGVVHLPVTQLAIRATNPTGAATTLLGGTGAIDIDEVWAVTSTEFDLDPSAALIAAPPGNSNLLAQLGVSIHFITDNTALNAVQAAGFNWVRKDLVWANVETNQGVYNWSNYDMLMTSLRSRSLKALFILDYGNQLYTGNNNNPPTNSTQITAFGNFAQAAASHYAGTGSRYEIWNEPNGGYWPPAPNASQYAALAMEGIRRVHAGDSNALVTTAGTSHFAPVFDQGYLAAGGGTNADGIGVHPYEIIWPSLNLTDSLFFLSSVIAQYLNPAPPVWDTEWGFSSASYGRGTNSFARNRQAAQVADELLAACGAGFPMYVYYDIQDDGTDPTNILDNYGLLTTGYSDKPAMTAVKALTAVARNRTFSGFIHTAPTTLTVMRFDGTNDQVFALWSFAPNTNSQVTVTVPTNATVKDMFGNPLTLSTSSNRLSMTLKETNGPVYFSFQLLTPAAPANLSAATASSSQINLSWSASTGANSYNVKRSTISGGPYTTVGTGVAATNYMDTGLGSGTTYYYVVTAVNTVGEGVSSGQATSITEAVAPTGMAALAGNSRAIISWSASAGAVNYNIKRATVSGGPYSTIATGISTLAYTNSALANGTTYYYVLSAVNSAGESANSTEVAVMPQSVSLIKDNADASGISIIGTWTSSASISGYYGTNYINDGNTGSTGGKSVKFTPMVSVPGYYNVYARWTADGNRATNAPIDVNYAGGAQTFHINQQANSGTWVLIGTFLFNSGSAGNITVRNDSASGYVIADAVELILY